VIAVAEGLRPLDCHDREDGRITDSWGQRIGILVRESAARKTFVFRVQSAGPDEQFGTSDDVVSEVAERP
jgi:hypothetical protein